MEEKEISSAEESLQIIASMIKKAKNTVADNSFLFLLWGWLAFAAGTAQFILKVLLNFPHHYYTWIILLIAPVISTMKKGSTASVSKTYIDYAVENLWLGVIASYVLFTLVFFNIGWAHSYTFYIFLMALSSFLTGKLLDFLPLVVGAIICGALVLLSTFINYDHDILICALGVLVSYVIPGHLLRSRFKKARAS